MSQIVDLHLHFPLLSPGKCKGKLKCKCRRKAKPPTARWPGDGEAQVDEVNPTSALFPLRKLKAEKMSTTMVRFYADLTCAPHVHTSDASPIPDAWHVWPARRTATVFPPAK